LSRTKIVNLLRQGLDEIGLLGLDENEKSVYPFSMSRKKWQALALGMAVFVEMGSVFVKAAEDERNAQFAEIQKEFIACQAALKKDPRSGIPFCGNLKAPKTISEFICQNDFFSCAKPVEKLRLKSAVAAWILRPNNSLLQIRKGRGNLAELISVITDPLGAKKLAQACQGGTVQGFKAKPCKKWDGGDIAGWVSGFISALTDNAHYFYRVNVGKASKSKTLKSIEKGPQNASPFGAGTGPRANTGVSRSFGVEQLYQDGAVTGWVVTNPKTGAGRWISVKYFTSRDPQTHQLIQQVGVFDYTENPAKIYGRRYAVGPGVKDVDADNLDLVPNRSQFHLTIKNGEVTVSAAGSSQPAIKTNIQDLKQLRLAQVNKEGYDEKIGNQTYKVIGQGGGKGALLFFKEDNKGQVSDFDPVAMAEVNQMTDSGVRDLPAIPYNTYLGFFNTGAGGAAQFWYMKRVNNGDMSYFKPVPCQEKDAENVGEKCDWPPAPKKPKSNGGQSSNQGQGGDNSGTVVAAGDCSAVSQDPNAVTVGSVSFIPRKGSPAMDLCAAGTQMAVSGLIKNVALSGDGLTLTVASPSGGEDTTRDYASIYKNPQFPASLQVKCKNNPGPNLPPCEPVLYGIPVDKETKYIIPMDSLKKKSSGKNLPSVGSLSLLREEFDLRIRNNKVDSYGMTFKAKSQNAATAFLKTYTQKSGAIPHKDQIQKFLASPQCAQGNNQGAYITIRSLLASELKKAAATEPVVSCGSAHLTAGDLLK
jgi:hypothetical protein